jgi:transcriptional regulator with XRE-family HTH domain
MSGIMPAKKPAAHESVGQRIRALRLANNLTQNEVAHQLGVSRSAITQWETDRSGQVRKNLERIAKVLGTSPAYLVSGETGSLQDDELILMHLYRSCASEDQKILVSTAKRLARSSPKL